MKRLIAGTCLVLAGCGIDTHPLPSTEGLSDCEALRVFGDWMQSIVPPFWVTLLYGPPSEEFLDEIPKALQFVLDNQATFIADAHPLENIEPGEVIDGTEALNGCWGRVQSKEYADGSGSRIDGEAVIIDLEAGSFMTQQMKGVDGNDCLSDSRPYIIVFAHEILSSEPDHLLLRISGGIDDKTIAGVDPDGSLGYHQLADFSYEISLGNEYPMSFTADGDFLITTSDDGAKFLDDTDRWFRFACPE